MFLDFIEIGTSDFDSLLEEGDDAVKGLSIDPVRIYLDRLPDRLNCRKINAAISDKDGDAVVHFMKPDVITFHGLPQWVRGCSSIGSIHPTVKRLLLRRGIPARDAVTSTSVPMCRLMTLLTEQGVTGIYFLKIDTEGHDDIILNDFIDNSPLSMLPHKLLFESNKLCDIARIHGVIVKLINRGYDIIRCETGGGATDTLMRLNITRVERGCVFSEERPGYYIQEYPQEYDPNNIPHENTLEGAMHYCSRHRFSGVTYQYGRYEVRNGKYLMEQRDYPRLASWIFL